mmetsp:Transcript_19563/g.32653  ORF Transcript_19563/g.32653 Transcript_19563/m.32653 type:complete len:96 (+) Transcript_19563:1724-2011(+)
MRQHSAPLILTRADDHTYVRCSLRIDYVFTQKKYNSQIDQNFDREFRVCFLLILLLCPEYYQLRSRCTQFCDEPPHSVQTATNRALACPEIILLL